MGTPGGGARSRMDTTHMPNAMEDEAFMAELHAQKAGDSIFGKPGGGAPVRNPDGSVNARTRGKAEMDKAGITDERANPNYKSRVRQIRKQQEDFMAKMAEWQAKSK